MGQPTSAKCVLFSPFLCLSRLKHFLLSFLNLTLMNHGFPMNGRIVHERKEDGLGKLLPTSSGSLEELSN